MRIVSVLLLLWIKQFSCWNMVVTKFGGFELKSESCKCVLHCSLFFRYNGRKEKSPKHFSINWESICRARARILWNPSPRFRSSEEVGRAIWHTYETNQVPQGSLRWWAYLERAMERHAIYAHELHIIREDQTRMMDNQAPMMEMMNKFHNHFWPRHPPPPWVVSLDK